jgi:hypothetical protein
MDGIWRAAEAGDLAEVQRLIAQDPSRLNAECRYWGPYFGTTPLTSAARAGH